MAGEVTQHYTNRYLTRSALLNHLKRRFPKCKDFNIQVRQAGSPPG